MATKTPPFVALTAQSSANSGTLVYSIVVRRPSEDLATSCPCAQGGQSHTRCNDAVRQTPLLPFTFPLPLLPFSFSFARGHILFPFPKLKGLFFLSLWVMNSYPIELHCYRAQPLNLEYFRFYPCFPSCITTIPYTQLSGYFIHNRLKSGLSFTKTVVVTSCTYWISFYKQIRIFLSATNWSNSTQLGKVIKCWTQTF